MLRERIDDALASADACRARAEWDRSDLQSQWLVLAQEWTALAETLRLETDEVEDLAFAERAKSLS